MDWRLSPKRDTLHGWQWAVAKRGSNLESSSKLRDDRMCTQAHALCQYTRRWIDTRMVERHFTRWFEVLVNRLPKKIVRVVLCDAVKIPFKVASRVFVSQTPTRQRLL